MTVSTLDKLINTYRAHFTGADLAEPAMVEFVVYAHRIDIQIRHDTDEVTRLVDLLRVARTLHGVTGRQVHTPDFGNLHIELVGRTEDGTTGRVYGGIPYRDVDGLVRLAPGEDESVTPDELYLLADLLQRGAA
jgi:hypothetical protein